MKIVKHLFKKSVKRHFIPFLLIVSLFIGFQFVNDSKNNVKSQGSYLYHDETYSIVDTAGDYTIFKRTEGLLVAQALQTIYEDEDYVYYFRSYESGLYILVKQGEVLTIQDALEQGKVTIDELMASELRIERRSA